MNKNDKFQSENTVSVKPNRLIIHNEIPGSVSVEVPKDSYEDLNESPKIERKIKCDLSSKNKKLRFAVIVTSILAFSFLLFLMFSAPPNKRKRVNISDKTLSSQNYKKVMITEDDIEQTISKLERPQKPVKKKYRLGDYVSYDDSIIDEKLLEELNGRDYSSPLKIVSNGGSFSSSRSPKLHIPRNTTIRAYIDREIVSGNMSVPISAVTISDLMVSGRSILPKGSRLIGKAAPLSNTSRVQVLFSFVVFPNGKEFSIRALAVGEDNLGGLPGRMNYKVAQKGGNVLLKSLLGAGSSTLNAAGNGFGQVFAGQMAANTGEHLNNAVALESQNNGISVAVAMNTRFKVLFN